MSDEEAIVVRSYRRVFRLERRIYRVDRFAIPFPGGIPLRGLLSFLAALLAILAAGLVPGLEALLALLPAPIRFAILPAGLAILATQAAPDGRPAHRFLRSWLAFRLRPRRSAGGRPIPLPGDGVALEAALPYAPDADDPRLRRARLSGPARIEFSVAVALERRRRGWRARPAEGGAASPLLLAPGERLHVCP